MNTSPPYQTPLHDFAYTHRYIILFMVLIDSIMANLDSSMVNIALLTITTVFHATLADSQWVITGYLLIMTSLFIIFGKISEIVGVCRLFIIGSVIFTLSSLGCGLSSDMHQLIFFRVLQGIGSSMVAGISTVIIFRVFPSNEIGRALGYSGSIFSVCAMCGPALGGIINDLWGWQYIFFINVPLGIILFIGNLKYLKIPEDISHKFDLDWIGAATLIGLITFLFLASGEISSSLQITLRAALYGGIFIVSGAIFLLYESRCSRPLLNLSIFRKRRYTIPVFNSLLLGIANFSFLTLMPFYFEGVMGLSSFEIGIILMINPIVQIFASGSTGWVIDQYHWRYLSGFGLLIVSVSGFFMGYALIALNFILILVMMILRSIGASLFQGQKNIDVMNALPREQAATASSVSTTAGCLGASLGVTLASLLITLELTSAGYHGPILSADINLLSQSVGWVIIFGGALCAVGSLASIILNLNAKTGSLPGDGYR